MKSIENKLLIKIVGILLFTLLMCDQDLTAQKYFTRDGVITFLSEAPLETIKAENKKVTAVLDVETGRIEFAVLIKAFQFKKALMQEHFNENYMESSKFPKAIFKGEIHNIESLNLDNEGEHKVNVSGELTIRGITKSIECPGTLHVTSELIKISSEFMVGVEEWNIGIPNIVKDNISKEVAIQVMADLVPFNN